MNCFVNKMQTVKNAFYNIYIISDMFKPTFKYPKIFRCFTFEWGIFQNSCSLMVCWPKGGGGKGVSLSFHIDIKQRPERHWQKQLLLRMSFTSCLPQEVGPPGICCGSCLRAGLWAEGLQVWSCWRTTEATEEDPGGTHSAPHCSAYWCSYPGPGQHQHIFRDACCGAVVVG